MHNVFIQCINTSNVKDCVCAHESFLNAHLVYRELLAFDTSILWAKFTVMRQYDKWRMDFETFLTHWSSDILEEST
jgi:hypothetical protein